MTERRIFMPDLNKPETWIEGTPILDPKKGDVYTFVQSNKPLTPDFPCVPRVEVLEQFDLFKAMIKQGIALAHERFKPFFKEPSQMCPMLREIHRLLTLLGEHEVSGLKTMWMQLRDLICFFLYEDTSYKWRLQWMIERADIGKLKMTDEDRFWFRSRSDFKHETR